MLDPLFLFPAYSENDYSPNFSGACWMGHLIPIWCMCLSPCESNYKPKHLWFYLLLTIKQLKTSNWTISCSSEHIWGLFCGDFTTKIMTAFSHPAFLELMVCCLYWSIEQSKLHRNWPNNTGQQTCDKDSVPDKNKWINWFIGFEQKRL